MEVCPYIMWFLRWQISSFFETYKFSHHLQFHTYYIYIYYMIAFACFFQSNGLQCDKDAFGHVKKALPMLYLQSVNGSVISKSWPLLWKHQTLRSAKTPKRASKKSFFWHHTDIPRILREQKHIPNPIGIKQTNLVNISNGHNFTEWEGRFVWINFHYYHYFQNVFCWWKLFT